MAQKSYEEIKQDLSNISPLALPDYIEQCEFYDMKNSQEILDKAIKEFKNNGGIAGNLTENIITSVSNQSIMLFLKKFRPELHKKAKKGKLNISNIVKQCINFSYPKNASNDVNYMSAVDEHYQNVDKFETSDINKEYDRHSLEDINKLNNFQDNSFNNKTAIKDVVGKTIYKNKKDANMHNKGREGIGEVDHIIPIKSIHDQYSSFARRYSDNDSLVKIINSKDNFQMLNGFQNASKGSRSNKEYIAHSDKKIDSIKNNSSMSKELKKREIDKHKISEEGRRELIKKQKDAESKLQKKLALAGSKTVLLEQIGRIIETMIGPISFELKDFVRKNDNKIYNSNENIVEEIVHRLTRAFGHLVSELPKLIGDLLGDLGQMLATLIISLSKKIVDIIGDFMEIITSGFSILMQAIKILNSPDMPKDKKGDAIAKIVIGFVTNVFGATLVSNMLEFVGIPSPFSEILAVVLSSVFSAVILHLFSKIDLFDTNRNARVQRIEEIFEARKLKLEEDTAKFDISILEKMREQRNNFEDLKKSLDDALKEKNFETLNNQIDNIANFFKVSIPYSSSKEFVNYVKNSKTVIIN